ncbi:MAG: AAA family ATPase [Nitrospirae bacterium]|nr:AAA family ATPase [Nitrospirota bacterium]
MYKDYFGLREFPFSIAPDPRYLFMSEQHRDALAHLVYGINSDGGFILLTGEVGTGKTTVCRCLLEQLPKDCDIAFILNPKVTAVELLATLCDELHINYPDGNSSIKVFVDLITSYLLDAHSRGRRTVLIIDEAQNLDPDVLEQVRLLTNLETNQRKLLQIIMLGQPQLREMLGREDLKQLSQRITARYHLGPLSRKDVPAYIAHRLAVAGVRTRLFPDTTIGRIFGHSGGVPRLINVLCDRALLGTYAQGKETVDNETLVKAADEVFGREGTQKTYSSRELLTASLTGLVIIAVIAGALLYSGGLRSAAHVQPASPVSTDGPPLRPAPDSRPRPHSAAAVRIEKALPKAQDAHKSVDRGGASADPAAGTSTGVSSADAGNPDVKEKSPASGGGADSGDKGTTP